MSHQPTRREALKTFGRASAIGAAQAAIVGLAVHASKAKSATPTDRTAWDNALAAYEAARAASLHYDRTMAEPARDAYLQAVKAIPHTKITRHGTTVSTADGWEVKVARNGLKLSDPKYSRHVKTRSAEEQQYMAELVAAADARDAAIAKLAQAHRLEQHRIESDRLGDLSFEALKTAIYTPAPTLAILSEKWAFLVKEDTIEGFEDAITADLAALAAREA